MSKQKSHPMPWWPRDFAADEHVLLMSMEAEGVYRRLLDHQWLHGSIPDDLEQLAALCKQMPVKRFREIWPSVERCFVPSCTKETGQPGRLVNQRLERVRAEAEAYRAKKSQAGSKGMASRWQTDNTVITDGITNVLPPSPTPSPTPSNNNHHPQASAESVGLPPDYQPDLDALVRTAGHPEVVLTALRTLTGGRHPQLERVSPQDVGEGLRAMLLDKAPAAKMARYVQTAHRIRTEPFEAPKPRQRSQDRPGRPNAGDPAPAYHQKYRDPYRPPQRGQEPIGDVLARIVPTAPEAA